MLPQGFTRVECVKCTGNQYADTKIRMDGYSRMVCKVKSTSAESSWLYGFLLSGGISFAFGFRTGFYYATQSVTAASLGTLGAGEYEIDQNQNAYRINTKSGTFTKKSFTCAGSAYYGAVNVNGTPSSVKFMGDLEDAQIYQSGNLAADLISCVDASGVAGFFDDVAKEFRGSVGEEAFQPGAALIPGALAGLTLGATSAGIMLVWNPSENANEYEIKRDGAVVAKIYGDVTSYTDTDADVTTTHTYNVTPYNGYQAGTTASLTVSGLPTPPGSVKATVSGNTVVLSWKAQSGADGYIVYRDTVEIARVSTAQYIDQIQPPVAVSYTVSAYKGGYVTAPSDAKRAEAWGEEVPELVYDRTISDVNMAKNLLSKFVAGEQLTASERETWNAGLKGCYNTSDVNRVEYHTRELQRILNENGYDIRIDTSLWAATDIMRYSDIARYLGNIKMILDVFGRSASAPDMPGIDRWIDYIAANDIEKILFMTRELIRGALAMFRRAGTFTAGNNYAAQIIRRA